ncbi:MAG TPA: hypothetical protein VGO45_01875 [Bacteroidia bacterium]|jgi:hypothetical protein|nr:hypothetical protein [Bacteroidia bacterium]
MKSILLCLLTCAFVYVRVSAQEMYPDKAGKHLYYGVSGGYGFPGLGQGTFYWTDRITQSNGTMITTKQFSLGKGPTASLYGGIMFSRHLGAEIGLNCVIKATMSAKMDDGTSGSINQQTWGAQSTMLRIIPAIRLLLGEKRIHLYTRSGLIMGIALHCEFDYVQMLAADKTESSWLYSGRPSWGFMQSVGALYNLTKNISVYAELTGIIETWAPAHSKATKDIMNGVDQLPAMNTSQKEAVYSSNIITYSYDANGNRILDPNRPTPYAKVYYNYNSIGFNIGMHVKFGKRFFKDKARYDLGN